MVDTAQTRKTPAELATKASEIAEKYTGANYSAAMQNCQDFAYELFKFACGRSPKSTNSATRGSQLVKTGLFVATCVGVATFLYSLKSSSPSPLPGLTFGTVVLSDHSRLL
jgi:hypothetical protein